MIRHAVRSLVSQHKDQKKPSQGGARDRLVFSISPRFADECKHAAVDVALMYRAAVVLLTVVVLLPAVGFYYRVLCEYSPQGSHVMRSWCTADSNRPCDVQIEMKELVDSIASSLGPGLGLPAGAWGASPRRHITKGGLPHFNYATCDNQTTFTPMPALFSYAIKKNMNSSCGSRVDIRDLLWDYDHVKGMLLRYPMDLLEYLFDISSNPLPYSSRSRNVISRLRHASWTGRIYYEVVSGPWKDKGCDDKRRLGCIYPESSIPRDELPARVLLRVHAPDEGFCWSHSLYLH
jgi:hypothetical protein